MSFLLQKKFGRRLNSTPAGVIVLQVPNSLFREDLMKLTDDDRQMIETYAKEAARRHYLKTHPEADQEDAWRFALRSWRSDEFIQAACDCFALGVAIDEAAAAPCN
jgi:hypothetical protein